MIHPGRTRPSRVLPAPHSLTGMWRRLRRRTMAPSRPAVYPDQVGLVIFTLAALAFGIYAVARWLL
jgi:hypothetical protein